jgi:hypothetical protein
MEVDPQATDAAEETVANLQLQLNLLSVIKSAQLQNGLKHGDYGRYRCVRWFWYQLRICFRRNSKCERHECGW